MISGSSICMTRIAESGRTQKAINVISQLIDKAMFSELSVAFIFGFSNVELMASFLKPVQNFIKVESKNEFS